MFANGKHDFDNDNDLEIIFGTLADVVIVDIIEQGGVNENYWNMEKGNNLRNSYFQASACSGSTPGDINNDLNIDIFDIR